MKIRVDGLNKQWKQRNLIFSGEKCLYEGKERNYTMKDIRPFTQYSFKVRAYTEGDESPFSEAVTIITEEAGYYDFTLECCGHIKTLIMYLSKAA